MKVLGQPSPGQRERCSHDPRRQNPRPRAPELVFHLPDRILRNRHHLNRAERGISTYKASFKLSESGDGAVEELVETLCLEPDKERLGCK